MDIAPKRRKQDAGVAPFWEPSHRDSYPSLSTDLTVDTAIIGGGVSGLACALELAERGDEVALVERDIIAAGSTGWCAGVLSLSTTLDLSLIEIAFGQELAQRIMREVSLTLRGYSLRFAETSWQTGSTIYAAAKRRHITHLWEEAAVRSAYGLSAQVLDGAQASQVLSGSYGALSEQGEHGVNPVTLMQAMARSAQLNGARIFERTAVNRWQCRNGLVSLHTTGGTIRARRLILAVGISGASEPERRRLNRFLVPVIGHVAVTRPSAEVAALPAQKGIIAAWDSLHLYHYVRYLADGRMLIGGEELPGAIPGVPVSADDNHVQRLHKWAREHHSFAVPEVEQAWRASLIFPGDGLPLVQSREIEGCPVVSIITDGLPFAFALGAGVGRLFAEGEDWLTAALSDKRKMNLQARLLSLLPQNRALRSVAYHTAFAAMRVADHV